MIFTGVLQNADIKLVGKHIAHLINVDGLPISSCDSVLSHEARHFCKRAATFCKQDKSFFYNFVNFRCNIDTSGLTVIEISIRRFTWPLTATKLLAIATFDVFTEIIHIIFGLSECD